MDETKKFKEQVKKNIRSLEADAALAAQSWEWVLSATRHNYSYNFSWMGRPIIQFPQDMVALQEIIFRTRPDLIVETGIAHGGSLILSASILAMLDYEDAVRMGQLLDPSQPKRRVLGVDIDIRAHNRQAIEQHAMASRIDMIQGSSINPAVIEQVRTRVQGVQTVMICLDSNHTHEHVLAELEAYAPLTSVGCYCVVFDTGIEDAPGDMFSDRPWGKGNNPKTAVWEYVKAHPEFEIDKSIDHQLQISVASDGFLKRTS